MDIQTILNWILSIWNAYWGDGYFQYLLLASGIYLLIRKWKEKNIRALLMGGLLILFLFVCPITAWIIRKCIGKSVYWRVLWLLPTIPVIAAATADLLKERKWFLRLILTICFLGAVFFSGKDMFSADNYLRVTNNQQISDTVAQICEIVKQHAGGKKIKLATDDFVASYARVYDASIKMPYGRGGQGAANKRAKKLFRLISNGRFYKKMAVYAKRCKCNYLALSMPDISKIADIESKGFVEIGSVGYYRIFALSE